MTKNDKQKVLELLQKYSLEVYECDCTDLNAVQSFQKENDIDQEASILQGLYEASELIAMMQEADV